MTGFKAGQILSGAVRRREFLQYAGAGALVGTLGLASAGCRGSQSARQKVDRSKLSEFPTLSLKERDRRWDFARKMMRENDVKCLLVLGDGADNYFTNDEGSIVIFPVEGEPVAVAGDNSFRAGSWLQNEERGEVSWVKDWRFRPGLPEIVKVIKEKELAGSRIGTIGALKGSHFSPNGSVSHGLWTNLTKALPEVTWVELWDQFVPRWLAKSEEELAVFRRAALLAEVASEAALEATRPGVSEADIFAAIQCEILRHGGRTSWLILHSGPDNCSWGAPKWQHRAQRPRIIQEGDIIVTEIFPHYGHLEAQAQMCIAVGRVAEINHKLARTAREAYEIGLKVIRPGVKFAEVAQAMNQPNLRAGYWHLTPNIHSMNPLECVSPVSEGIKNFTALMERFPGMTERQATGMDIVLRPGMTFQLEPNSCWGRNRINIGGNVIVTEDGCEELNSLPCEMRVVG